MEKAVGIKHEQFDAVILATDCSEELSTLGENCPSVMFSLGSRPIISYQLSFLASNRIHRVIIAVAAVHSKKISKYVEKRKPDDMIIEVLPIEPNIEGNYLVEDVLVALSTKITKDFILMDGQVVTDCNLSALTELHYKKKSIITMCLQRQQIPEVPQPHKKGSQEPVKRKGHYTAYGLQNEDGLSPVNSSARVVFVANDSDYESGCTISKALLKKAEKISFYGDLLQVPICVCQPSLLLYARGYKNKFFSFFNDLIPYFIQMQFSKDLVEKIKSLYPEEKEEERRLKSIIESNEGIIKDPVQVWALLFNQMSAAYMNISNKQNYLFANSEAMKMQEKSLFHATYENWPHILAKFTAEIDFMNKNKKKALPAGAPAFLKQVADGSLVSEEVVINEGVLISKSLVCPGCKIGKGTKIVNCILHFGAEIGEDCSLISCVVGSKAKICRKSTVKDELIGRKQSIDEEVIDS